VPSSPVTAPTQETSHEVFHLRLTLLLPRLAFLTRQCYFSGSNSVIIKPAVGDQSSCRGDGKSSSASVT
jgi:hypothetical protein